MVYVVSTVISKLSISLTFHGKILLNTIFFLYPLTKRMRKFRDTQDIITLKEFDPCDGGIAKELNI